MDRYEKSWSPLHSGCLEYPSSSCVHLYPLVLYRIFSCLIKCFSLEAICITTKIFLIHNIFCDPESPRSPRSPLLPCLRLTSNPSSPALGSEFSALFDIEIGVKSLWKNKSIYCYMYQSPHFTCHLPTQQLE